MGQKILLKEASCMSVSYLFLVWKVTQAEYYQRSHELENPHLPPLSALLLVIKGMDLGVDTFSRNIPVF